MNLADIVDAIDPDVILFVHAMFVLAISCRLTFIEKSSNRSCFLETRYGIPTFPLSVLMVIVLFFILKRCFDHLIRVFHGGDPSLQRARFLKVFTIVCMSEYMRWFDWYFEPYLRDIDMFTSFCVTV